MFKRLRWMGMGAVAGIGASAWAQRRLHQTLQQHPSILAGADVVSTARRVGKEVKGAVADGRRAMAEREAALRAEIDIGGGNGDGPTPGPPRRRTAAGRVGLPAGRAAEGRRRLHIVETTASETRPPSPRPFGAPRRHRSGAGAPREIGDPPGLVSPSPDAPPGREPGLVSRPPDP